MFYKFWIILVLCFILTCTCGMMSENDVIIIPLNKTVTLTNKEMYGEFITITKNSTLQFDLIGPNNNVSFLIFQVHSHLYNVTLYNNSLVNESYIYGRNIGLYTPIKSIMDKFFVWNNNEVDLKIYVSVHGYNSKDPIPGGCNMEFSVPVFPSLQVIGTKDYVIVEAAPPSDPSETKCQYKENIITYFYRMYLPENNYEADTYFEGIRNMMTYEGVEKYGTLIDMTSILWRMRRMLSAYPGTGVVFVAVSRTKALEHYSVYVPYSTYLCSPLIVGDCQLYDDPLTLSLCALLLFVGAIMSYFGHRFFKAEMFLVGMLSGAVVTYISISLMIALERLALIGVSLLTGLLFGAIWLMFWWLYGIPVFSVFLASLNAGFLIAAIIYFTFSDPPFLLQNDANFWSVFILVMLLVSLVMILITYHSNLLCCAFLGSYAVIFPIDCYIGTNLKYILVNTFRRALVPDFNKAVITPPFESRDVALTLGWILLTMTGYLFQLYQNRSRPPFPPPPRSVGPVPPEYPALYDGMSARTSAYGTLGRSSTVGSDRGFGTGHSQLVSRVRSSTSDTTPLLQSVYE